MIEEMQVYCGDSGYVACVKIAGIPYKWEELSEDAREHLRSEGLVGLSEWLRMKEQIDAA